MPVIRVRPRTEQEREEHRRQSLRRPLHLRGDRSH